MGDDEAPRLIGSMRSSRRTICGTAPLGTPTCAGMRQATRSSDPVTGLANVTSRPSGRARSDGCHRRHPRRRRAQTPPHARTRSKDEGKSSPRRCSSLCTQREQFSTRRNYDERAMETRSTRSRVQTSLLRSKRVKAAGEGSKIGGRTRVRAYERGRSHWSISLDASGGAERRPCAARLSHGLTSARARS